MGITDALSATSEALARLPLASLIPQSQNIVYLEHNTSVGTALQLLARRHILSAPLVVVPGLEDMAGGDGDGVGGDAAPQLIGWVTVESILRAFLAHMEEKHGRLPRNMLLLMTLLEKEGPAFAEKTLITLAGSEDRGLLFQVHSDVALLTALRESFVPPGKPAAHRLAVFDPRGSITAVISQLDVIRHLRQHPELLGPLSQATVRELGWATPASVVVPPSPAASPTPGSSPATAAAALGSSQVGPAVAPSPRRSGGGTSPGRGAAAIGLVTVDASVPALLAYERMARAGVSGAPVVAEAESGGMIANLSMSDLRNIQTQHLGILALPVGEFLALLHGTSYLGYSQRTSAQAAHPFFAAGPPSALPPSPSAAPGAAGVMPPRMASSPSGGGAAGGALPPRAASVSGAGGEEGCAEGEAVWGVRMITCTADTTLERVLALLSDNRVHRVYVVEACERAAPAGAPVRPLAVITPTDILRLLAGTEAGPAPGAAR
ncbi:hypothetical protein GPECTOR_17g938 [Gonium pectorale]|uniref:CBS domain-containing protein n=1 Tax=Gonium pectorale TaxID=33097 RepID=A0A150GKC5_GONPE|nr:hypothetical protein GPECTOR_17g938 [Gonium pectorale]|eukprot:KXZ50299.1 hypothetical protein GPECTOR_17g938 [Gonium pectorale]